MAKQGIYKNCKYCDTVFYEYPYLKDKRFYCSQTCSNRANAPKLSKDRMGDNNPAAKKDSKWRHRYAYNKWREECLKRDKFSCIECGENSYKKLVVHHIKSYKDFPKLRIEVSNGVTLCRSCHNKHDHGIVVTQFK